MIDSRDPCGCVPGRPRKGLGERWLSQMQRTTAERPRKLRRTGRETVMACTTGLSDSSFEGSPAGAFAAEPYSVVDLGDGTAMLQLDVEVSWSTILQILRSIRPGEHSGLERCRGLGPVSP